MRQWNVEASGFGVTRYRGMNLRWLNTGRPLAGQSVDRVSGNALSSRDFRLCEACGKLDTDTRASSAREHRPWCRYRSDSAEHVIAVDLMRELSTEALAFVLPLGFATDRVGVDSLASAILLGLEITTGGSPDHLGIASVPHPVAGGAPGETRPALLLHDTVPGGTGYLTDHDDSSRLWNLLIRTGQHLESCPCRAEGKDMCPDCLRPHAVSAEVTRAAALHAIGQLLGREDTGAQDTEGMFAELDPEVPLWDGHRRGRARRHRGEPPGGALPRRARRAPGQEDGRAHHQRPLGRARVGDRRGPLADPSPARRPRHPPRLHLPAPRRPQSHRHLHRRPQLPRQSHEQPSRRRRRQTCTPARRRLPGHLRKRRRPGRAVEPGLAE